MWNRPEVSLLGAPLLDADQCPVGLEDDGVVGEPPGHGAVAKVVVDPSSVVVCLAHAVRPGGHGVAVKVLRLGAVVLDI